MPAREPCTERVCSGMNVGKRVIVSRKGGTGVWAAAILGIVLATLSPTTAAPVNLVTNGSFEFPNDGALFYAAIPAWTLVAGGGGLIEISAAGTYGVTGEDGVQVCELDSDGNSRIKQDLA